MHTLVAQVPVNDREGDDILEALELASNEGSRRLAPHAVSRRPPVKKQGARGAGVGWGIHTQGQA